MSSGSTHASLSSSSNQHINAEPALSPRAQLLKDLEHVVNVEALKKLKPTDSKRRFFSVLMTAEKGAVPAIQRCVTVIGKELSQGALEDVFEQAIDKASSEVITCIYLKLIAGRSDDGNYLNILKEAIRDSNLQALLTFKALVNKGKQKDLVRKVLKLDILPSIQGLWDDHKNQEGQFLGTLMELLPNDYFRLWANSLIHEALESDQSYPLSFVFQVIKKYPPQQLPKILNSYYGEPALYQACDHPSSEIPKVFLDEIRHLEKDVQRKLFLQTTTVYVRNGWTSCSYDTTAIHAAAKHARVARLHQMISLLDAEDRKKLWKVQPNHSLLQEATSSGCLKTLEYVLKHTPADELEKHLKGALGSTLLDNAVSSGNSAVLKCVVGLFKTSTSSHSVSIPWNALAIAPDANMLKAMKPLIGSDPAPEPRVFLEAAKAGNLTFFRAGSELFGTKWETAYTAAYHSKPLLKALAKAGCVDGLEFFYKRLGKRSFLNCPKVLNLLNWAVASRNPKAVSWVADILTDKELEAVMETGRSRCTTPLERSLRASPGLIRAFKPILRRLPRKILETWAGSSSIHRNLLSTAISECPRIGMVVLELFHELPADLFQRAACRALTTSLANELAEELSLMLIEAIKDLNPEQRKAVISEPSRFNGNNLLYQAVQGGQSKALARLAEILTAKEVASLALAHKPKYSPLLDLCKSENAMKMAPSFSAVLNKLTKEQRATFLATFKGGDNLFHRATQRGTVACLFEIFTNAEIRQAMVPNDWGSTPLHYLMGYKQMFDGTKIMCKFLGDTLITELQRKDKSTTTALAQAIQSDNPEALPLILKTVDLRKLLPALLEDSGNRGPVILKVVTDAPEDVVIQLFFNASKEQRKQLLKASHRGENVLHLTAKVSRGKLFSFFFQMMDDTQKLQAMKGGEEGATPLHYLLRRYCHSEIPEVVDWLKKGGRVLTELSTMSLFFELDQYNDKGAVKHIASIYTQLGMNPLQWATTTRFMGISPVGFLIYHNKVTALKQLIEHFGKDKLAPCVLDTAANKPVLNQANGHTRELVAPLVMALPTAWHVARAYEPQEDHSGPIEKALLEKYKPEELERMAIAHGVIHDKQVDLHITENGRYGALTEALKENFSQLQKEQSMLLQALRAGKTDPKATEPLLQVLLRIPPFGDSDARKAIEQLLARYPLTTQAPCLKWLAPKLENRQAALYLIPLHALSCRGVNIKLLNALHLAVQKLGRNSYEGSVIGKQLLLTLIGLAQSETLTKADLDSLLKRLLKRQKVTEDLIAIGQIVAMGKDALLTDQALATTSADLRKLAMDSFLELIPMGAINNFSTAYARYIANQRKPGSLLVYASRIATIPETRQDLGKCLKSVLTGKFDKGVRYSDHDNPHLAQVYKSQPYLRVALPKLVKDMPAFPLGDVTVGSKKLSFPMDQAKIKELVDWEHLDLDDLPYLKKFLKAKKYQNPSEYKTGLRKDLSQALRKQLQAAKQMQSDKAWAQFHRLKLSQHLINLCHTGKVLEAEQNKKNADLNKIRSCVKRMAKELELAIAKAEALGGTTGFLGEFANDLQAAMRVYENSRKGSCDEYTVSLTDHYWDLFRIGSDVEGSCQRVDGAGNLNKCLLGYVMDGKTIPIVVRKPNSPDIIARRLLRIELTEDTDQPVLFLEKLYTNRQDSEIDEGIMEMARRTADHLQLPLYLSWASSYTHSANLKALKGPTAWVYSDAGGGAKCTGYSIRNAPCIHMPQNNESSSDHSSSSSSSSK